MATQRDRFRAYYDEDSMSLDDLLMQIQQPQIDTEAIARQQIEAQIRAQQEAQARAQIEAQIRAQQEAQRQAQIAAEQRAYEEQVYRQAQARQEELRAQNAARLAAEQEAARQAQLAQERAQAQARAQAEQQARAQQEAQRQAQIQAQEQAEAQRQAQFAAEQQAYEDQQRTYRENQSRREQEAERQAQERAQAEAQARAQQEAQARAQAEAQARLQAEAQARVQAEARAQQEAQARAQAEQQRQVVAQQEAQRQAEIQAQRQAEVQQQAERQAQAQRLAEFEAQQQAQIMAEQEAKRQVFNQRQPEQPITAQEVINQIAAQPTPVQPTQPAQPIQSIQPAQQAPDKASIINNLVDQIKARSDTSKWSGGYGADEATKDMARILSSIGITDIKDFGKVDKYEPVEQIGMNLNGQAVQGSGSQLYVLETVDTGEGTDYVRRDLSPEEAKQVQPTYGVQTGIDEYNQPTYAPVSASNVQVKDGQLVGVTGQTFGNKLTGQAVPVTYSERQKGDFFGGTFEGKGNTGYGVQFDAKGNPVFYTQGASSTDSIVKAAIPIASLALAAMGAPSMLGNALLGAGANQVAAGALGGALIGGGTAALTDQNVGKGALLGGAGGALSGYLSGSPTGLTDRGLAIADAKQLAASGIPTGQITEILTTSGYPAAIVDRAINAIAPTVASVAPVAANNLVITAPSVAPSTLGNVISTIAQQPAVNPEPVAQPIENVQITAPLVQPTAPPTLSNVISAIAQQPTITPVVEPTVTPPVTKPVVTPVIEPTPSTGTITNPPLQNLQISTPAVVPNITDVISAIALQPTPVTQPVVTSVVEPAPTSVEITTQKPTQQVDPNVLNAVNTALQTNVTKPIETVQITGQSEKPKETPTIANVISTIATPSASAAPPPELVITGQTEKPTVKATETQPAIPLIMSPTAPTSVPTEPVKPQPEKEKEKSWTAKELAELARLGLLATSVLGAGQTGETGFPIVPIPADWKSPTYGKGSTSVAPTQLPPIDFGNRELLRGTQWEKFLDPNYGQVPAPVQFNQPTNMSYDRLMSILGTGRDVLPSQALTINDVISGIQNQYGQTTNSAMGQKPT